MNLAHAIARDRIVRERPRPAARPWFEWAVSLFATWFVVGLYLDGWAHIQGLPENFFTPWHAVIYSGFFGAAGVLAGTSFANHRRGASWRQSLPIGYGLSLVGVGLFTVAGVADLLWHSILGVEAEIEALFSPPHLLLAAGGALIASGALRAAWSETNTRTASLWRAVLSQTLLLAVFAFFTAESHPFVHPWAWQRFEPLDLHPEALALPEMRLGGVGTQDLALTLGMSSVLLQTAVLAAMLLLVIRRWGAQLPAGWLTFTFVAHGAGLSAFHATPWTIIVALAAGVVGDVLYRALHPSIDHVRGLRWFAAALPVTLYAFYFLVMAFVGGTWWSTHMWSGAIALAGLVGWLVSYLIAPPLSVADPAPPNGRFERA